MGRCSYNEKWRAHNPCVSFEPEQEANLGVFPDWFDTSLFEEEQLAYLAEYEIERRGELLKKILEFLSADKNRRVESLCVLDKLINRPELKWRDAPAFYGVSNHNFFLAKSAMELFFAKNDGRFINLLKRREKRDIYRSKKIIPDEGQMFLDL